MNTNQMNQEPWVQHRPYTLMLQQYCAAADRLMLRLRSLQQEYREMQQCKKHTLESANAQRILERRMDLLRSEYYEITDCMREIGIYAAKESQ